MSSQFPRAGLVAVTKRRAAGGAGREAGGAAGARPRAPGGRIVFLRRAAAGVGAATGTQDSPDPTAPARSDPSSIPFGRSSRLARAPITDCELGAVRSRCPPAAILVPLTRISEQVPRSRDGVAGRRGGPGAPQAGDNHPKCERDPGGCQRAVCLTDGEGQRSWGARREEGTVAEPGQCTVGRRVRALLPIGFLRVASSGLGSAKGVYLRRAPYRGWKTWSLDSPAGKLRL